MKSWDEIPHAVSKRTLEEEVEVCLMLPTMFASDIARETSPCQVQSNWNGTVFDFPEKVFQFWRSFNIQDACFPVEFQVRRFRIDFRSAYPDLVEYVLDFETSQTISSCI